MINFSAHLFRYLMRSSSSSKIRFINVMQLGIRQKIILGFRHFLMEKTVLYLAISQYCAQENGKLIHDKRQEKRSWTGHSESVRYRNSKTNRNRTMSTCLDYKSILMNCWGRWLIFSWLALKESLMIKHCSCEVWSSTTVDVQAFIHFRASYTTVCLNFCVVRLSLSVVTSFMDFERIHDRTFTLTLLSSLLWAESKLDSL
jgi:hypothetical protein